MLLGLALAMFLNQKLKGKGFLRTLFYLPNIFSMVAVSMAWLYLYDTTSGILNKVLKDLGMQLCRGSAVLPCNDLHSHYEYLEHHRIQHDPVPVRAAGHTGLPV